MPVHKTKDGGYRWGKTGKVYHGANAKEKATKQGIAIKISQEKTKERKQMK